MNPKMFNKSMGLRTRSKFSVIFVTHHGSISKRAWTSCILPEPKDTVAGICFFRLLTPILNRCWTIAWPRSITLSTIGTNPNCTHRATKSDARETSEAPRAILFLFCHSKQLLYMCVRKQKQTSPPLNAIIHWPTQIQPKHGDVLNRQGTAHTAECIHLRLAWRLLDPNERRRRASKATLSTVGSLVSRWLQLLPWPGKRVDDISMLSFGQTLAECQHKAHALLESLSNHNQ